MLFLIYSINQISGLVNLSGADVTDPFLGGPGDPHSVIARSEATWRSRSRSNPYQNKSSGGTLDMLDRYPSPFVTPGLTRYLRPFVIPDLIRHPCSCRWTPGLRPG